MCGIAGFAGYRNGVELAGKANDIQFHRGPDHQGIWSNEHIALAHQRLSIIDLSSRSDQPLVKDRYIIVFNGEIYNYRELRDELVLDRGITFQTASDTEVVLEAYRRYGASCVGKFIGMFAFAVYDTDKNEIFIARDHFGIKPLFYTHEEGRFAFSSELKTLARLVISDKSIDYNALVSSLNYLWVSGNRTMFNGVSKLPPGCYMTVDSNLESRICEYERLDEKDMITGEPEALRLVDRTFNESIKRHMVSDVPVCSFLSGGLDSSLIAGLAGRYTDNLSTYTIATNPEDKKIEQMPDDERYAKRMADKFGFDHNEIVIDSDIVGLLPDMVRMLDEPIGDPAAINTFLICSEARKRGVKVLLSGMGADEVFFGYRRQKATLMAAKYRKYVPSFVRNIIHMLTGCLPVRLFGRGLRLVRWAKKFLSFSELPLGKGYMQSYSYYNREELGELLNNQYRDEIEALYEEHERIFSDKYNSDPVNQMCNTDIRMFMVGLNLTYTDRASMASSVEVRVPFIDIEMIRAGMQIPGNLKYKKGESKYILKKVAEKYIPREIIYRPKASFGAPIRFWISNPLRGMVDELLSEKSIEERGIFNGKYIRKLINEDRQGIADNAYRIYQLLTLELWFRAYLDENSQG